MTITSVGRIVCGLAALALAFYVSDYFLIRGSVLPNDRLHKTDYLQPHQLNGEESI